MNEYELIRTEIRDSTDRVSQYNSILYATTAALLAFAFDKDSFVFCLIPYVVIVPLYILSEITSKGQCNQGAYLYVFYEGIEYHWEQRHHEYDKRSKLSVSDDGKHLIKWTCQRILHRLNYFSMNLICSAMAIYKVIYSNVSNNEKWIQAIFVIALTVVLTAIMIYNITDYVKERGQAIEKWQAIKAAEEEAQKRKNNRNPQ